MFDMIDTSLDLTWVYSARILDEIEIACMDLPDFPEVEQSGGRRHLSKSLKGNAQVMSKIFSSDDDDETWYKCESVFGEIAAAALRLPDFVDAAEVAVAKLVRTVSATMIAALEEVDGEEADWFVGDRVLREISEAARDLPDFAPACTVVEVKVAKAGIAATVSLTCLSALAADGDDDLLAGGALMAEIDAAAKDLPDFAPVCAVVEVEAVAELATSVSLTKLSDIVVGDDEAGWMGEDVLMAIQDAADGLPDFAPARAVVEAVAAAPVVTRSVSLTSLTDIVLSEEALELGWVSSDSMFVEIQRASARLPDFAFVPTTGKVGKVASSVAASAARPAKVVRRVRFSAEVDEQLAERARRVAASKMAELPAAKVVVAKVAVSKTVSKVVAKPTVGGQRQAAPSTVVKAVAQRSTTLAAAAPAKVAAARPTRPAAPVSKLRPAASASKTVGATSVKPASSASRTLAISKAPVTKKPVSSVKAPAVVSRRLSASLSVGSGSLPQATRCEHCHSIIQVPVAAVGKQLAAF